MHVGGENAGKLQRDRLGSHEHRSENHAIRNQLRRNREEKVRGFRPALVLHGGVAHGDGETAEEEVLVQDETANDLLRFIGVSGLFVRETDGRTD